MYLLKVNWMSYQKSWSNLMNGYKIFNGAKYFSLGIFQNYLVFIRGNLMESQKEILKSN